MSDVELLTIGRVNLDLYAQEPGVDFPEVHGWDAMVGGSPTNVAIAASRLGLRGAALTAVGEDLVGDWVLRALEVEGVDTAFVARKRGPHTSLALRAQLAPAHPLAFYRHDPADIHFTAVDASDAPVEGADVLLVSADALARGSMREACAAVVRRARDGRTTVYLDLDLRDVNWPDLETYAALVDAALDDVDVVIGTEAEFATALLLDASTSAPALINAVSARLARTRDKVAVVKHGHRGATIVRGDERVHVAAHPVDEASTVGAGDSFAAGLIAGRLAGMGWEDAGRFGSACAAITVSRFGCSSGFPSREEVGEFLAQSTLAGRS